MKKLQAKVRISDYELMYLHTQHIEKHVKQKLARDLAEKLVSEITWTEREDYPTMSKEITAEIFITDKATVDKYDALLKAIKILKEV